LKFGKNMFRIGMVREPCDYYFSEYKWRFEGNGWLHMHLSQEAAKAGEDYELKFYGTEGNQKQFKDWLYHISGVAKPGEKSKNHGSGVVKPTSTDDRCGLFSMRIWLQNINGNVTKQINDDYSAYETCSFMDDISTQTFQEHTPIGHCPCPLGDCAGTSAAKYHKQCASELATTDDFNQYDCWIRTDHASDDLRECMELYKKRGGTANLPDKLEAANTAPADFTCDSMFDAETEQLVMGIDGTLSKKFGYTGCCKPHPSKDMFFPK